jgi:hypothetical protein
MLFAGCDWNEVKESGESSGKTGSLSMLAWDPPQTHEDSSPLDPYKDLDYYEFYVRNDLNFTENDLPVAQVAAVADILSPDGISYIQSLISEFELANLLPFLPPGSRCYLCIRAVGMDGLKSDFSEPIAYDQT